MARQRPELPIVRTDNMALNQFTEGVRENLERMAGTRGDALDRVVTLRDLQLAGFDVSGALTANDKAILFPPDLCCDSTTPDIEAYAMRLYNTRVFQTLITPNFEPAAGTFSNPTPADLYSSNVSLLLYGNGANGGTSFPDYSGTPKTVTGYYDAKTSTAQSVYGGSSIYFDASNDYLETPQDAGFDFGLGDFSLECYVRFETYIPGGGTGLIYYGNGLEYSAASYSWALQTASPSGSPSAFFSFYDGVGNQGMVGTSTLVAGTWYYMQLSRSGSTFYLFVDGVLEATKTAVANLYQPTGRKLMVGRFGPLGGLSWQGHIAMVRITKGVARKTATFTPDALPFPRF